MAMPPAQQPDYIPSVRARRLARSLEQARKDAGFSQASVGASLGWSQQKVHTIEKCRRRADPGDVELMLDLYGIVSPDREAILALAREAGRRSWWTEYGDLFDGSFPALEDAARRMRMWDMHLVPGIFQTPEYARALISSALSKDPEAVERRLRARIQRQAILTRPTPPDLHVILDEAIIGRPVGGPSVLAGQLRRLVDEARRDNVTIQMMPRSVGTHPGLDGGFMVFQFAEPDPDVGYCEGRFGAVYLENPHQVARCNVAFERIRELALSPQESMALIEATAKSL